MMERLADLVAVGNLLEAGLWLVFAFIFLVTAVQSSDRKRRLWLIVAAAFLVFSISDVIEAQTGAWWRPLWLLALKGGCIAVFVYAVWTYRRIASDELPEVDSLEK